MLCKSKLTSNINRRYIYYLVVSIALEMKEQDVTLNIRSHKLCIPAYKNKHISEVGNNYKENGTNAEEAH